MRSLARVASRHVVVVVVLVVVVVVVVVVFAPSRCIVSPRASRRCVSRVASLSLRCRVALCPRAHLVIALSCVTSCRRHRVCGVVSPRPSRWCRLSRPVVAVSRVGHCRVVTAHRPPLTQFLVGCCVLLLRNVSPLPLVLIMLVVILGAWVWAWTTKLGCRHFVTLTDLSFGKVRLED
jgi:hypothetical protein